VIRKIVVTTAIALSGISVAACSVSSPAPVGTDNGSLTCSVGTNNDGVPGWVATFTNSSSQDITVSGYTALFFGQDGGQTGSEDSASGDFTVAAGNSYTDDEYHSFMAPVPGGSVTCRITNVSESS
jgi:hypothetical protein